MFVVLFFFVVSQFYRHNMATIGCVADIIDAVGVRTCDTSISMTSIARPVDVKRVPAVLEIILLSSVGHVFFVFVLLN